MRVDMPIRGRVQKIIRKKTGSSWRGELWNRSEDVGGFRDKFIVKEDSNWIIMWGFAILVERENIDVPVTWSGCHNAQFSSKIVIRTPKECLFMHEFLIQIVFSKMAGEICIFVCCLINLSTPKIWIVILLTICHIILTMSVWREWYCIGSTNNPLTYMFLCSHPFSIWYCIDNIRKNSVLVTHRS